MRQFTEQTGISLSNVQHYFPEQGKAAKGPNGVDHGRLRPSLPEHRYADIAPSDNQKVAIRYLLADVKMGSRKSVRRTLVTGYPRPDRPRDIPPDVQPTPRQLGPTDRRSPQVSGKRSSTPRPTDSHADRGA